MAHAPLYLNYLSNVFVWMQINYRISVRSGLVTKDSNHLGGKHLGSLWDILVKLQASAKLRFIWAPVDKHFVYFRPKLLSENRNCWPPLLRNQREKIKKHVSAFEESIAQISNSMIGHRMIGAKIGILRKAFLMRGAHSLCVGIILWDQVLICWLLHCLHKIFNVRWMTHAYDVCWVSGFPTSRALVSQLSGQMLTSNGHLFISKIFESKAAAFILYSTFV